MEARMGLISVLAVALAASDADLATAACEACEVVRVLPLGDGPAPTRWVIGTIPAGGAGCAPSEWRVVDETSQGLRAGAPFFTEVWGDACDYGPSGYGVEVALVGDRFTYSVDRGGPVSESRRWVWRIGDTVEPLVRDVALLDRRGPQASSATIDLASRRITYTQTLPDCAAADDVTTATWLHVAEASSRALERPWTQEGPSSIGASVSDAADGLVLSGARGVAGDAAVSAAVIDGRVLVVDVVDDVVVRGPVGDAIVVSFGQVPGAADACIARASSATAVRVPLSLKRGRVGAVRVDSVTPDAAAGVTVRYRLRLEAPVEGLTVAYEDVDGDVVERVIATSRLDGVDAATLGRVGGVRDL